jgi:hypothetical protein
MVLPSHVAPMDKHGRAETTCDLQHASAAGRGSYSAGYATARSCRLATGEGLRPMGRCASVAEPVDGRMLRD